MLAVSIDYQPTQTVALAEYQPCRAIGLTVTKRLAESKGRFQPPTPKSVVQRFRFVPSIEANMNAAATIENPSSNKAPLIRNQVNHVTVGRRALDTVNGRIEDPGMPAKKWPGFARL